MSWATQPFSLATEKVLLRTLEPQDVQKVATAICDPQSYYATRWGIKTVEDCKQMLRNLVDAFEKKTVHPLVYFVNNEVAGITKIIHPDAANKTFEIGGTWLASQWRPLDFAQWITCRRFDL